MRFYSVLLMFFMVMDLFAQDIERGPYLQMPTPTSMTIMWNTDTAVTGVVYYGEDLNSFTDSIVGDSTTRHEITLSGLIPDTRYYYRVTGQDTVSPDQYFVTSPPEGTEKEFRIMVVADYGQVRGPDSDDGARRLACVDMWKEKNNGDHHADLLLALGDLAEESTDEEYRDNFLKPLAPVIKNSPVIPVLGNHDVHDGDGSNWRTVFATPAHGEGGGLATGTEDYYSFNYGNIHFVVLSTETDSKETPSYAEQGEWLEKDLAANDLPWLIAMFHRPMHTGGHHYSDGASTPEKERKAWLTVLQKYHVDLIMSGHNHVFERSMYIKDANKDIDDITDADLYDTGFGRPDVDNAYQKDNGDGYVMMEVPAVYPSTLEEDYEKYTRLFKVYGTPYGEKDSDKRVSGFVKLIVNADTMKVYGYNVNPEAGPEIYDYFTIIKDNTPIEKHTLKINVEGKGTVVPPDSTRYRAGSIGHIEAKPDYGWEFDHWSGDLSGSENPTTIIMDDDKSITAVFVETPGSVVARVSSGTDDAEEYKDGTVKLTSSDLELFYDGSDAGQQTVGIRFDNLQIPKGSVIENAFITFTATDDKKYDVSMKIQAEDADNSSTFTSENGNISSRPRTETYVVWEPDKWQSEKTYDTPELKSIVQRVVDRSGWKAGNAMSFIFSFNGDDPTDHAKRVAYSYDGDPEKAAILQILIDEDGTTGNFEKEMFSGYSLSNYPNPFHNSTKIDFSLPEPGHVNLTVYDIAGRVVSVLTDRNYYSGNHSVMWNAGNRTGSGSVFILVMRAGHITKRTIMILSGRTDQ